MGRSKKRSVRQQGRKEEQEWQDEDGFIHRVIDPMVELPDPPEGSPAHQSVKDYFERAEEEEKKKAGKPNF